MRYNQYFQRTYLIFVAEVRAERRKSLEPSMDLRQFEQRHFALAIEHRHQHVTLSISVRF